MTSEEVMMLLYDHCRWNSCAKVQEFLTKYSHDIDLTYDEGRMFRATILRSSPELFSILLEFYKNTQLKGDKESLEYKKAHYIR